MIRKYLTMGTLIVTVLAACQERQKPISAHSATEVQDPIPSMNEGKVKSNIIDFVTAVTNEGGPQYVKPEDRIVVFDNDGTLWVEQPLPNQIYFDFERLKTLSKTDASLAKTMPFKAVVQNDTAALSKLSTQDIVAIVGKAQAIDNVQNFDTVVNNWLQTWTHPTLHKKYTGLVYQPMLEIINYLKANQFKVYIVSGGSVEFMRPWAPATYGIPKDQIIGTTFKTQPVEAGDSIVLSQTTQFEMLDDKEGKVQNINRIIGKKPIMVFGNSDGDLAMMEYTDTQNPLPHLLVYVKHDDGEREFLYTEKVISGALIQGERVANERGWSIISMKNDWKQVFPTP